MLDLDLESHRGFLRGVAYRMTGTVGDADDIVQEAFARTLAHPPKDRTRPMRPWLVSVTMNVARDVLRRRRRQGYVGPWLPGIVDDALVAEGVAADADSGVDNVEVRYGRKESVTFAFLIALEALTPLQRAVLVLREVYDFSGKETAAALGVSDDNVKTILSRAKKALRPYSAAPVVPTVIRNERDATALQRFLLSLANDDVDAALALLREDVVATSDGGGVYSAGLKPWTGRDKVVEVWRKLMRLWPPGSFDVELVTLNAQPAIVLRAHEVRPELAPRWVIRADTDDEGRITALHTLAAPAKLATLTPLSACDAGFVPRPRPPSSSSTLPRTTGA